MLDEYPASLSDVIGEVLAAAALLGARLHPTTAASLAELVRVMNCYYSNLIEGHNTRPRDIERALRNDLDDDSERRDLQLEARAHISLQRKVDALCASGSFGEPASIERVRFLHREFYRGAPARMLLIQHPGGNYTMTPGEFRADGRHDVSVGRHLPPSSEYVLAFMQHFEARYTVKSIGKASRVLAMAAAHHRLNYIHPFVDRNGRVSRLMSHAMAHLAGIGAHGLWSISRGLARGLADAGEYKRMMDDADSPRRGDLDGRGNLSREALIQFVTWFSQVALDQLNFMQTVFDFDALEERLAHYVTDTLGLADHAARIPTEVLRRGQLARGEVAHVTQKPERTARAALSALTHARLLVSDTPKGPVRLNFTVASADVLFPRLFGAQSA